MWKYNNLSSTLLESLIILILSTFKKLSIILYTI